LLALVVVVSSCASDAGRSGAPASSAGSATAAHIVSLGDSVPAGTACECAPYPELSAADLSAATHRTYVARNDAVAGFTTTDVIDQLDHEDSVVHDVRAASAVTVEIGANDVAHSSTCGNDVQCYLDHLPQLRTNLDAIVQRVRRLAGAGVPLVLLDYWSVWLGGTYAEEQGNEYAAAADRVTSGVNDTILGVAQDTGAIYVGLREAFRGPDDTWDETHLLAADGEHPNAEGHRRIAQAIADVVRDGAP
jgi:lysophospholipase L1-like esterase